MPAYEYRCKNCGQRFTLTYKTYDDYDAATPQCPHCQSLELSRLINRVALQKGSRNYAAMQPNEMLSVLDSGDSRQVGEMFRQVGGEAGAGDAEYHEATERLLKGEKIESVSRDMEQKYSGSAASDPSSE